MTLPIGFYTLYNNFENCAHKAWHLYVLKDIPRVESPEMKWGNDVHSAMEHRVGKGIALPDNMRAAEPIAATLDQLPPTFPLRVEYKLGMKQDGTACDFFGNDVWFRGKIDVAIRVPEQKSAWILDWKTGKTREEPFELETNALLLKVAHPDLETIVGEYFWMQTGQNGHRYTLNRWSETFAKLQGLYAEMQGYASAAAPWPKRKNPLCGWCPVLSCEHNKSAGRK